MAAGCPLIIFPTSFGNYRQNKDFGLIDSVAWFVDNNRVTIYCPDSIDLDSFYNKGDSSGRSHPHAQRL